MHRLLNDDEENIRATHGLIELDELGYLDSIEDEFSPEEIFSWSQPDDQDLETISDPLGFLYDYEVV